MIDHFALLDQPRRPWLDQDALKQQFHRLTAEHHPDVNATPQVEFSSVTAAYRLLSDPKTRLKHLIELEFPEAPEGGNNVPKELVELFMQVAGALSIYGKLLKKLEAATIPLTQALIANEKREVLEQLQKLAHAISALEATGLEQLKQLDQAWLIDKPALLVPLIGLGQKLAFLQKWADQIREAMLRLQM